MMVTQKQVDLIVKDGEEVSGGWGYWGHSIRRGALGRIADKAWVAGLAEKGFSDTQISEYGDWRDGRHIADSMSMVKPGKSAFKQLKKIVKESSIKPSEYEREVGNN